MRNNLCTRHAGRGAVATIAFLLAFGAIAGCSNPPETPDSGATVDGDPDADGGSVDDDSGGTTKDTATQDTGTEDTGGGKADAGGEGKCVADKDCEGDVKANADNCEAARCEKGKCVKGKADEGAACKAEGKCYEGGKATCDAGGKCIGEVTCKPDPKTTNPICVESFCDAQNECGFKSKSEVCDDGNECTKNDKCAFKQCNGEQINIAKECDDNQACTEDTCDPKSGCKHEAEPMQDKPCSTGDQCSANNTCDKGVCGKGVPVTCDDKQPCTKDSCDSKTGCVFKKLANGATCDDGSACTNDDKCDEGKCVGELKPDAKPTSACEQLSCNPKNGNVTAKAAQDGLKCNDGKPCTIGDQCLTGQCKGKPLICNLGNPCKDDFCDVKTGSCAQKPKSDGTKCDDANACSTKTTCKGGSCTGVDWKDSGQCDDKNACTSDGCSPKSGCFHVPANDKFCDDGNACTELDKCFGGKCAGQAKTCDDNNPCTKDACDPKNGKCTNATFVGPCDDGKKCTTNTICVDGKCTGDEVTCDDKNPCTSDICDSLVGCKYSAKAGGAPCDDGVSCTLNDKCDGGQCKGDDKCLTCATDTTCLQLDDSNPCTGTWKCTSISKDKKVCQVDPTTIINCQATADECSANICNPKTAKCELKVKAEGTPCLDANKCEDPATKVCNKAGTCQGDKKVCADNEACTTDSCEPFQGCVYKPKADKLPCDDGSVCTPSTECVAGKCTGKNNCECTKDTNCAKYENGNLCDGLWKCLKGADGKSFCGVAPKSAVTCPDLKGQACMKNTCDKGTGKCGGVPVADGGKCDDGDACTIKEACTKGKCLSNNKVDCNDNNPCTVDVCGKVFGCGNAPVNEGGICNDGNACSINDKCAKGKCTGKKKDCNDGNQCTVDICDAKKGGCAFILNDKAECDDGNPCTSDDTCKDGKCTASALKCDDGNDCTIDACDGAGGCKNVLVVGKDCSDNEACTVADTCGKDGKCNGKQKNCSDGNDCTKDACVKGACVVTADIGKKCSDNNACTENDKCDPQGSCVSTKVNCDDGNPCTAVIGACSPQNGCNVVQSDGKFCDDGDKCTINSKCQGGGCQGVKLNCDDGNKCTTDSCEPKKGCKNTQNVCNDNNDCTSSKCDKVKGCQFSPIDGFQPCDDGNGCTKGGVCNKTKCEAQLIKCDDKNECTKDSCDPKKLDKEGKEVGGCVYLPVEDTETKCDDGDACTTSHCDGKGGCHPHDIKCDDGNPCTKDTCDKLKGCITDDLKEAAPCDDGDECTKETVCQGGFCSGGKVTCPICPNGTDKECAIFDDNDLCNGTFQCKLNDKNNPKLGGKCVENKQKVICDSINDAPCVKNQCNSLTGKCKKTELLNGSPCEDGVPCTIKDSCNNGSCQSGVVADCSSVGDDCNEAVCVGDVKAKLGYACVGLPKQGTVTCDADKDGCTANDRCDGKGKCVAGKKIDCQGLQGECETVACESKGPKAFTCKISIAKNYSACDDGQLCTAGDFCESGKCKAGLKTYSCLGKNDACADFACDKKGNGGTGACMPKPKNEGGGCNADDNGCTVKDICVLGKCIPGAPANCSEKNGPCTIGACKSGASGAFTCVTAPRNEKKPCDADSDGCTLDDHCEAGKCVPGKVKDCSSFNGNGGCLVGACVKISSSQGSCKAVPAQIGKSCNADDNGCTKDDKCNKDGACINGSPVNCLAFAGTCATGKCVPDAKDHNKFTCKGDPKTDGTKCDADGDGCTVNDKCAKGKCVPGKAPDCSKEAKGACILGGCKNKGSDQYLCLPVPKKDGDICDADKNGCTVKDTCIGGTCAKGPLETCKDFAGLCATALCNSDTPTKFTCKQTPKESYPNLAPEVSCKPSTEKAKPLCPENYVCTTINVKLDEGVCNPKVQITCADGDACSENDVCAKGKCSAGKQKDCDDKNGCTLDSCLKGKCQHKPIAGCNHCIDEDWEYQVDPEAKVKVPNLPDTWVRYNPQPEADAEAKPPVPPKYAGWAFQNKKTFKNSLWALQSEWKKDVEADNFSLMKQVISRLQYRRIYAKKGQLTMTFQLHQKVNNQSCTSDNLALYINNTKVWERCKDTLDIDLVDGFLPVKLDLSKLSGAHLDIDFRILADASKAGLGVVTLDDIRLTGNCGPGCVGSSFEDTLVPGVDEGQTKPPRIPAIWKAAASAPGYLAWKVDTKIGHTDKASLKATWAKTPPGGKQQTATLTIPEVTPSNGDSLYFALRMASVGSSVCGEDDLNVLINGKVAYKRCSIQKDWVVQSIDLSPHATKKINIVFEAKSGKASAAKGTIELDDIAISGKCTYLCMYDDFDTQGLKKWNTSSTDIANIKWVLSNKQFHTKPNSAYAEHGKLAKDTKGASLLGKASAGMQVIIPIAGAEYEYHANVSIAKDLCGQNPQDAQAAVNVSLQVPEEPIIITPEEPDPGDVTWGLGDGFCDNSQGWKTYAKAVPGEARGRKVLPAVEIGKVKGNDSTKAYFDTFKLVCK